MIKKESAVIEMLCRRCGTPMKYVLSFEDGKAYEYYRCGACLEETRHIPFLANKKLLQEDNNTTKKSKGKKRKQVSKQKRKGKKHKKR